MNNKLGMSLIETILGLTLLLGGLYMGASQFKMNADHEKKINRAVQNLDGQYYLVIQQLRNDFSKSKGRFSFTSIPVINEVTLTSKLNIAKQTMTLTGPNTYNLTTNDTAIEWTLTSCMDQDDPGSTAPKNCLTRVEGGKQKVFHRFSGLKLSQSLVVDPTNTENSMLNTQNQRVAWVQLDVNTVDKLFIEDEINLFIDLNNPTYSGY